MEVTHGTRKPILVLDFDGVLHAYTSGWQGIDVVADGPVDGAADFLYDAAQWFDVAIVSSRSVEQSGRDAMRSFVFQVLDNEFGGDVADATMFNISFPEHKPPAFLTIDDRAITFDGTFPDIDSLLAFRPWNK